MGPRVVCSSSQCGTDGCNLSSSPGCESDLAWLLYYSGVLDLWASVYQALKWLKFFCINFTFTGFFYPTGIYWKVITWRRRREYKSIPWFSFWEIIIKPQLKRHRGFDLKWFSFIASRRKCNVPPLESPVAACKPWSHMAIIDKINWSW